MPTSYRVVEIIVPNHTPNKVKAELAITRIDPGQVPGLHLDAGRMDVGAFGLTPNLCGDVATTRPRAKISVTLDSYQDTAVRVIVTVREPPKGKQVAAAFQVSDTRNGAVVGGVTVVCTTPPYPKDLPSAAGPKNPCPLVLARDIFCVDPGADPRSVSGPSGVISNTHPQDLVALVANDGKTDLTSTTLCLEHTDSSGVTVAPQVWHLGTVEPGGQFWATWAVDARQAIPGQYSATFVAQSDGFDPVRLRGQFRIGRAEKRAAAPRQAKKAAPAKKTHRS